jgi:hypothetical protein
MTPPGVKPGLDASTRRRRYVRRMDGVDRLTVLNDARGCRIDGPTNRLLPSLFGKCGRPRVV